MTTGADMATVMIMTMGTMVEQLNRPTTGP